MTVMAKGLVIAGMLLIVVVLCLQVFGSIPWIGRLPGDILIKGENFTIIIPITTCLLLSAILSLAMFTWNQK